MKKITLVFLFCICAVGFSQAQIEQESSGTATSNDSKSALRAIAAPPGVPSKSANVVKLTGNSSELEKSILAPKTKQTAELKDDKNAVSNGSQELKKEKLNTIRYRSLYSSWEEERVAASQGKVTRELVGVKNERTAGPQNYSADYGARVSQNRGQQSPIFRVNSNPDYIARTAEGDYTAPTSNTRMANLLTEGFDDITTLAGAGYTFVNASDVIGTTDWFQGNTTVFDSQAGAPEAYVGANFNSTGGSEISNWMITPVLNLENGDEITFWTRTVTANTFPDRLEVRLSPDGSATAPASPTDVGSYTELLLEINPTLMMGGYPDVWTEFTVTVTGLTGATNTSVAFRYFVTDAGPTGNNSNYIGIDTLSIDEAVVGSVVTGYSDIADFQNACTGTLALEDFSNGPADFTSCGPIVSSAGDGCFVAGELVDGFDTQASNAGDIIFIGTGALPGPNTIDLVGPTAFANFGIINFTGPDDVFAVAVDVWNNLDPDTDFRVYDTGGALLDTFTLNNPINTVNFFGVVSTTAIGRVEIEGLNASGELFGNLQFGDCSGGGALMLPLTFEGQTVPFSDFNGSVTQTIPNPDASGVNTSATVAENVVPANAAFAGVNIVVPVDLTDDKMFSMNVWSPLADTPVLLKLEGGPNPPVERQANLTTTGAWEEIVFDFSSEGAITFDSVTIFMNFNMTDPANQTFYWDNLAQFSGGGGGPVACSQENPLSAVAGGGLGSSVDSDFKSASDIVVAAGEDFTIDTIDTYFLTFAPADPPTTATVMYYEDAGGLPGAMIGSETVVPTVLSSQPWANPIADQYEMTMSVTPFTFPGDAGSDTTYWIEVSMGTATNQPTVFWEYTNDTPVVGNPAAQFDATVGTWSIPDPTQETVYSYEGECTPMGGGGMACNQDNPLSAVAGGGLGSSVDSDFKSASDIVVAAGEDFTIDTIDTYFLTFAPADPPTTANVAYYEDAGGLPGALIGSETVVPTVLSSQPWANPIADQYEMTMSVTPFTFPGDAGSDTTYWIEVSMGTATNQPTVFWEYTNDTPVVGNPAAQFDGTVGTWSVPDPTQETVYNYSGECTPIMGPPALEFPITHESQVVPFSDFNGSVTQQIANPDASGVNTSATVAENFVPANAAFAGVNIVIDVDLTNDKFFAMDVWSPLADTPVLLKLEGGPNPAVERQVNLTTTGAWEEVIFDFSSEGAITFESVTIFMNFNMVDPADQTFYWDNLERLNALPGPSNDLCANAIPMSCGDIVAGTTINATDDSAIAPTCDTTVTSPGVWYIYEDTTGLITDITITMCNGTTDYDSKLSVYTGDCGDLICEVGNDDTCGLQSEVSFQSDGATTFYILVHGFGGATGNFEIEMNCTLVPPPNDMIANSIDVDEIGFPYTDPSVAMPAATIEAGSPVNCDNSGARGVWYNFVPEGDGTATASITTPGGGLLFTVNNGPLAGSYPAVAAGFGAEFTTMLVTEDTVVVLDDDTTGDPNDACDPILNGADLAGKIAIVRRGACEFGAKALAAQNEGAIAVIVVNNQPGDPIVMGGGVSGGDVTIPALMVTDVDGEAIIAELSGASVNVSMGLAPAGFSSVTFYTAPNENAVETDLVLVDWFENQCLPGTTASIPTVAGQAYYVFVANHSAVTDIVIDGTNLGTQDNVIEGFVYYPNPAGSTLNLSAQDTIESATIYNMLGQKVLDQNVNATTSELNVSDLATGAYILQVSVNGQISTYQILKK